MILALPHPLAFNCGAVQRVLIQRSGSRSVRVQLAVFWRSVRFLIFVVGQC